jgi:hypothetical protein
MGFNSFLRLCTLGLCSVLTRSSPKSSTGLVLASDVDSHSSSSSSSSSPTTSMSAVGSADSSSDKALPIFVIAIPGGGVREDKPAPWVMARLDLAAEMYFEIKAEGKYKPICITQSYGTPHRPNPIVDGKTVTEAAASAKYLLGKKVPASDILEENTSVIGPNVGLIETNKDLIFSNFVSGNFEIVSYRSKLVRRISHLFNFL